MMTEMKRILIFAALLLLTTHLQAQVTMGAAKEPESFSVLELISNQQRGLRLPQLDDDEKLEAFKDTYNGVGDTENGKLLNNPQTAPGLRIFNKSTLCVETWNGAEWIMECSPKTRPYALGEVAYRISDSGPIDGRMKFATKNLGATTSFIDPLEQIAAPAPVPDNSYSTDETIYGSLYQWGRYHDGHESRSSANYPTNDNSNESSPVVTNSSDGQVPLSDVSYGKFIKNNNSSSRYDWSQTRNDLLWGDNSITIPHSKGIADPCPSGFRVPSQAEWASIVAGVGTGNQSTVSNTYLGVNKWQWVDGSSTLPSNTPGFLIYPPASTYDFGDGYDDADYQTTPTLFLPAAGYRGNYNGQVSDVGQRGYYWGSTILGTYAYRMDFGSSGINSGGSSSHRSTGLSVRCLSE
jgi:uncharacterized protein (TIGR02145 family)